jgi:hypothetical protein
MRVIKRFGPAALSAFLAMVLFSSTAAMAEPAALCMEDTAGCVALQHVHYESVGKGKVLTSIGNIECNILFLADALTAMGLPLRLHPTLTYSNCTLGGSICSVTEENGPGELTIQKEGHETAKVTATYLVHVVCGTSIDCSFNGASSIGTAKGPLLGTQANGEIAISEASMTKETGGFLCPKTAKLDITTTPLLPVYVRSDPSYWCKDVTSGGEFSDSKCLESRAGGLYKKVAL